MREIEAGDEPRGAVLDPQIVSRLDDLGASMGEDLTGQLAGLFLSDVEDRMHAMGDALARTDAPGVEQSAHALRGASANLGATNLARLCGVLEMIGESGDLTGGDVSLRAIEKELTLVRPALRPSSATP